MSDRIQSEAELIDTYLAPLTGTTLGAYSLRDDCATYAVPQGDELVLTTDAVAAGVHFFTDDAPEDIAWKALAVNVSDLVAKGAQPVAYLMAMAFPEAPERAWMERFAAGLREAQDAFAIRLIGGDTDRRPGPLSITITALGTVPRGRMVQRATARSGDLLFVSGTIGDSALGLRLREQPNLKAAWGLDEREAQHLLGRYRRPEPRVGLRWALLDCASAAMDISDGLAKDLGRLCKASGVGAEVRAAQLPLSAAASRALEADPALISVIVSGGDDYEVLTTVPPAKAAAFRQAAEMEGVVLAEIGRIGTASEVVIAGFDGRPVSLRHTGWDHF